MKIICNNKKAKHNFFIEQSFNAGIVLKGSEVKSLRMGNTSINDSYVTVSSNNEVFIKNMYIKAYDKANSFVPDERQSRKLLLNKSEIKKISAKVKEKGFSVVPLKVYFTDKQLVKVEIALAKGKHTYDKKDSLALKDIERETKRDIKNAFHHIS